MRRCYLVCYDIRDAKRLRRVHKVMKGFGEPWQYSVFFCVLRDIDRVRMENSLRDKMNTKEDLALLVDLGADEEEARETVRVLGPALPAMEKGTLVV
ncbi:MAG: CRISPR-associated endonuclease Cas2 [bacterium]